jgi:hypothetical protein
MARGFLKGFMAPEKGLLKRAYPGAKSYSGVKGIAVFGESKGYSSREWGLPISKVEKIPNRYKGAGRL